MGKTRKKSEKTLREERKRRRQTMVSITIPLCLSYYLSIPQFVKGVISTTLQSALKSCLIGLEKKSFCVVLLPYKLLLFFIIIQFISSYVEDGRVALFKNRKTHVYCLSVTEINTIDFF